MKYSVIDVGFLLVPRGISKLIAMEMVAKLSQHIDACYMIFVGFVLTTLSLWEMRHFSLNITGRDIVHTGITQGFGIGLTYVSYDHQLFDAREALLHRGSIHFQPDTQHWYFGHCDLSVSVYAGQPSTFSVIARPFRPALKGCEAHCLSTAFAASPGTPERRGHAAGRNPRLSPRFPPNDPPHHRSYFDDLSVETATPPKGRSTGAN